MDAVRTSEVMANIFHITWRLTPADENLHEMLCLDASATDPTVESVPHTICVFDGQFRHLTGHPETRAVIAIITTHTHCCKHRSCQFPSCHTWSCSVLVDCFHQTIRFLLTLIITNGNSIHRFARVALAHYRCFVWWFCEVSYRPKIHFSICKSSLLSTVLKQVQSYCRLLRCDAV
jgi:hypothetical protein